MNQSEIKKLISIELLEEMCFENLHGITKSNINDFLVEPVKKRFLNPLENTIDVYWVVFDENKNDPKQGYLIFYSEKDTGFGLATKTTLKKTEDIGTFIGVYGSFINTISSM